MGCMARCVVDSNGKKTGKVEAIPLTWDHHPGVEEERQRVENNGSECRVESGRDGMRVHAEHKQHFTAAITRALGDTFYMENAGGTFVPSVAEYVVSDLDQLLLVCSDGVWEVYNYQTAVNNMQGAHMLQKKVDKLVSGSQSKEEQVGIQRNTTVETSLKQLVTDSQTGKSVLVDDSTALAVCLQTELSN